MMGGNDQDKQLMIVTEPIEIRIRLSENGEPMIKSNIEPHHTVVLLAKTLHRLTHQLAKSTDESSNIVVAGAGALPPNARR